MKLLDRMQARKASAFVQTAVDLGLPLAIARRLEAPASEHAPAQPASVLESRAAFEEVALRAVIGDAGNLELSFRLVDALATAVETLGLARNTDVPDPFRRVWVTSTEGLRRRGVVLTHRGSEIAVFAPPRRDSFAEIGDTLHVSYRGASDSVGYQLQLNDAVALPRAYVLHLTRPGGGGAIGRQARRHDVDLTGTIGRRIRNEIQELHACRVVDLSLGGLRAEVPGGSFDGDHEVVLTFQLPDEHGRPLEASGVVRFVAADDDLQRVSVQFQGLGTEGTARMQAYLQALGEHDG